MEAFMNGATSWIGANWLIVTGVCAGICLVITVVSGWNALRRRIVDNGASYVVTIGVMFTFIGIAVGLWNFDTAPDKMTENIDIFLSGMKTAFWTSIIGMLFGIIIKFIQSGVEQKSTRKFEGSLDKIVSRLESMERAILTTNNATLQNELGGLVTAMKDFVRSSSESRGDMKNLADSVHEQSQMFRELGETFTDSVENLAKKQGAALEKLSEKIAESGENQSRSLDAMMTLLSAKIIESGEKQAARLDKMNAVIEKMQAVTEQAQENSAELLRETKTYQQQSLDNDEKQAEILRENTARITDMRDSFDKFMKEMVETWSEKLVKALNESIKKLNRDLEEQFGENFKELNRAVFKLVEWQENYRATVEQTTGELRALNEVFAQFTEKIVPRFDANISALTDNLQIFAETTEQNVGVQEKLGEATARLNESVAQTVELVKNFKSFSEDVLAQNNAAFEKYRAAIEANLAATAASITTLGTETTDTLKKFTAENKTALDRHSEMVAENLQATANSITALGLDTTDALKKFTAENKTALDEQRAMIEENLQATAAKITALGTETTDTLKKFTAENKTALDEQRAMIEENLQATAANITALGTETTDTLKKITAENKTALDRHSEMIAENLQATAAKITALGTETTDALKKFTAENKTALDRHSEMIAENLQATADAIISLGDKTVTALEEHENAIEAKMSATAESVKDFSSEIATLGTATTATFSAHAAQIHALTQKLASEIREIQNLSLTVKLDTADSLKKFQNVSASVLHEIDETLEKFNAEFQSSTNKSLANLDAIFKAIGQNTKIKTDQSIKELGGALAAISQKLRDDYSLLISSINELNQIIGGVRK